MSNSKAGGKNSKAGGKNTTVNGGAFEKKSDITQNLLNDGFTKK